MKRKIILFFVIVTCVLRVNCQENEVPTYSIDFELEQVNSKTMDSTFTAYCLIDSELLEENETVKIIKGKQGDPKKEYSYKIEKKKAVKKKSMKIALGKADDSLYDLEVYLEDTNKKKTKVTRKP